MAKKIVVKKIKKAAIKKIVDAYDPVNKQRDMVREAINDGAYNSHLMENRDDGSK